MEINFKKICEKYHDEALKTLIEDVKIDSVYDPSTITKEHPYGEGVSKCFAFIKALALKDGFSVDECEGHCLEISYGEGSQLIGIFAHQDVVPVNGEWKFPPFGGVIDDGKLYGRGTSDDKGPGISAYYALKALKENGLIDGYRVKLVFGGDEERGSSCLTYYFTKLNKEQPTYGFTPDAEFPLIYGEKGITNYEYRSAYTFKNIVEIDAGTVPNSVIDRAKVVVNNPQILDAYLAKYPNIKFIKENENTFVFLGKPAHGSTPNEGVNAGIIALLALGKAYNEPALELLGNEYSDPSGKNLHQFYETKNMGATTYNVGVIKYKNGVFSMIVNFRYPEIVVSKEVIEKIQECSPFKIVTLSETPFLYFNPETTPFIKVLADIYEEESGDNVTKPMAIGGGTYAKEAKNTVAFGSHFPGKLDCIHSANEKIDLVDFYSSMPIYAHAIYKLGKLK